ncbi:MAG: response regulator transcription factor [Deltaproteobacteria bacterium]|nr:response regulator transcription factor [Deltaproteobacteria bacterium]
MTPPKAIRILTVEDHFLARLALSTLIGDQKDMEIVGTAESGREATVQYAKHKPDVVLMDLRLPEMDGVETTAAICGVDPRAHILVVSNYESEEDVGRAIAAGALGYVKKDVNGDVLISAIRTIHAGQRYFLQKVVAVDDRPARSTLTPREIEVLDHVFRGRSNREIADLLTIGEGTVRIHVSNILLKLGVKRRTEAVAVALKRGLLRAE